MKGKVVAITGASSGIGEALAREFASKGSNIAICARRIDKLEKLKVILEESNIKVVCVKADVGVEEDCANFIKQAVDELGQIDILINNAGISMNALFEDVDLNVVRKLMDINFWGAVYCTKYAMPYLLESKGSVVAITSIAGYTGLPGRMGYCASKYALHGFLDSLRIENFNTGVNVLLVAPNYTASEIRKTALSADGTTRGDTPLKEGKLMTAKRVAELTYIGIKRRKRTMVFTTYGKLIVFFNKWWPQIVNKTAFNNMLKEPNSMLK